MIKKYTLESLNIYILILSSIIYIIGLFTIDLFPKTTKALIIVGILTMIIISLYCYLNKKNTIYNIGIFLTLLLNVVIIYNIINLNNRYDYITNVITKKYEYKEYDIYVLKKNPKYNELEKLNNKTIGILNENNENFCNQINNDIEIKCLYYSSLDEIEESIKTGIIQSFALSKEEQLILNQSSLDIKKQSRIIKTIKIKDSIN
ncbi:MAG: hypothetical protein ACI4XM_04390 [Candidatus Coprovivens sp.]